ncbi:hypothetical protein BIW11_04172 [Tropilaelaps mercedesae]|uniref:G-patch domain-containing protein n=1 Tax=Tropilaelaps mercedesae TaxID=418985 RepID=A0A1V9XAC5_9ACAR|nr:hypothetical protein BIW11_04172 [Tropilaelaps mercedesae]
MADASPGAARGEVAMRGTECKPESPSIEGFYGRRYSASSNIKSPGSDEIVADSLRGSIGLAECWLSLLAPLATESKVVASLVCERSRTRGELAHEARDARPRQYDSSQQPACNVLPGRQLPFIFLAMTGKGAGVPGDGAGLTFAEKMMKKMGWTEGKGLGKDESGIKDFIKPKMKLNTKGIGFTGVDHAWVAHQEVFDELLSSLNKGKIPAQPQEIACLTSESKLRGRTKFYSKMMRGKDLSSRSANDLSSIIIPLAKKDKVERPKTTAISSELDGTLKPSDVSMNDYFKKMMAQRKLKMSVMNDTESSLPSSGAAADSDDPDRPDGERKPMVRGRVGVPDLPADLAPSTEVKRKERSTKSRKQETPNCFSRSSHCGAVISIDITEETSEGIDRFKRKKKRSRGSAEHECAGEELPLEDSSELPPPKQTKKSRKEKIQAKTHPDEDVNDSGLFDNGDFVSVVGESEARKNKSERKRRRTQESSGIEEVAAIDDSNPLDSASMEGSKGRSGESTEKRKKSKKARVDAEEPRNQPAVEVGREEHSEKLKIREKNQQGQKREDELRLSENETSVEDWPDDATRLNVNLGLLRKIRGPSLKRSEASPTRELSDEQIQEVYRLWTGGDYGEYMRKIHAGELPRWIGMDKSQLDRMMDDKSKMIDLVDLREKMATKFEGSNLHEIWGYKNKQRWRHMEWLATYIGD